MPADLRELLHSRGRSMAEVLGSTRTVTVSRLARGICQAQARTIRALAESLALPVEHVAAACDESWRRAHPSPPAPAVGPVAHGQPTPQPET